MHPTAEARRLAAAPEGGSRQRREPGGGKRGLAPESRTRPVHRPVGLSGFRCLYPLSTDLAELLGPGDRRLRGLRPRASSLPGFSLVEAVMWGAALVLVAGLVATCTHWARLSWSSGVERLDQLGALRMAALRLSNELAYARRIIYPPAGTGGPYHQLVFVGPRNEVRACFVDPDRRLTLFTREAQDTVELLTRATVRLEVKRPVADYLEYFVAVQDEQGRERVLSDGLWIRNHE